MEQKLASYENAIEQAITALERGPITPENKEPPPELASLRDMRQRAKKLRRAYSRPQSLGFFGPSQAGKSFLIGALLAHELGSLEVIGRRGNVDFLRDVNPAKGVESTGVVTRFSARPPSTPLEHGDFECRMLSLDGLLASLATGFLVECTAPGASGERIDRVLREARLVAGAPAHPRYREAWESVWLELGKRWGDRHPYLAELRRHPELRDESFKRSIGSAAGWSLVYSLLWGGAGYAPDLDQLAKMLVQGLELLNHAETIEVELAHVRASSEGASILDAACLNSAGTQRPPLAVFDRQGRTEVRLEPGVIAALMAEIRMTLKNVPGALLESADLLDFPGGRALRGINGFGPAELSTGRLENAIEVFKRGKLTFLFEQFAIDREITALVLCSPGPNKPEAIQMQHQVERWIHIRYGGAAPRDPQEIGRPSLFIALTKFDTSLGALRSDNARDRWESRVGEACVDFWSRGQRSWLHEWGGRDRPFTNMFWVRNPYADQMNTLKPSQADYDQVKRGYHEAYAVRTFIADHGEKWAAMEGEDEKGMPRSGVPLLASHLRAKLGENVKAKELAAETRALQGELVEVLRVLAPSRDEAELRARLEHNAKSLADAVRREMARTLSGGAFGRLMDVATLPRDEIELEIRQLWATVAPMSIKGSDKVKRLMVHVLKWWTTRATERVREAELGLPMPQVERFVREVCRSKPLLAGLGPLLLPQLSRSSIDFALVATLFQLRIGDGLLGLYAKRDRRTPPMPLRLSFAETPSAEDPSAGVDWADVDFEDEESPSATPAEVQLVFAGSGAFEHWASNLGPLYVQNSGAPAAAIDARAEQIAKVLREVEATHGA